MSRPSVDYKRTKLPMGYSANGSRHLVFIQKTWVQLPHTLSYADLPEWLNGPDL